jgi:hypothetical protein
MNTEITNEDIKNLCDYVTTSFHLCNVAFSEIWYLTQLGNTDEEIELINSHSFRMYQLSLQYFFIMEYTKLLHDTENGMTTNVAAISKLNKKMAAFKGKAFESKFDKNVELVQNIRGTSLYDKVKKLRDKKFAHSDNDVINDPFNIPGFSSKEIRELLEHVKTIATVIDNCTIALRFEFDKRVPNIDNRTYIFIKQHAIYKQSYLNQIDKVHQNNKK